MPKRSALSLGFRLGRYEIQSLIHSCACNEVYRATDTGLSRTVAIKIMSKPDEEDMVRFFRSAQVAGMMKHPNICAMFETGKHEERGYLAMEFVEGETLADLIAKKAALSYQQKLKYMIQVCDAAHFIHSQGAVHGQIGVGSVMRMPNDTVKLLKLGAARLLAYAFGKRRKKSCIVGHTPPEQLLGKQLGAQSEVWLIGCLLYELLTNQLPFDGSETPSVILKILNEEPPPMKTYWIDCPPALEAIVARSLEKDPKKRYESAAAMADDLKAMLGAAASA